MSAKSAISKITESLPNTYIIFFDYGCGYSESALNIFRSKGLNYKGYEISKIDGGISQLLRTFNSHRDAIAFNPDHHTKPMIFFNKKFIGGFNELNKLISS